MTAKEYLQRGRRLSFEIEELIKARDNAFDIASNITSVPTKEQVQTTVQNGTENKIIGYIQYVEQVEKRIKEIFEYHQGMLKLISEVSNTTYRTLLIDRYINCLSWNDVAINLSMTERHILRLHGRALAAAEREYKKRCQ